MADSFYPQRSTSDGIHRTHETWSNNGLHYTLNTASFTSPTISIEATGRWPQPLRQPYTTPMQLSARSSRSRGGGNTAGGFFGAAFDVLEDILAKQDQQHDAFAEAIRHRHPQRRHAHGYNTEGDEDGDEDDDSSEEQASDDRRGPGEWQRSPFSRRQQENRREKRSQPWERTDSRRDFHSRRSKSDRQQRLYQTEDREPSWAQPRMRPQPDVPSMSAHKPKPEPERNTSSTTQFGGMAEALENAVEVERRAVRSCKQRIASATRLQTVSSEHLQQLVNEMRRHEEALKNATSSLNEFKQKLQKERSSRQPPPQSRRSEHRRTPRNAEEDGMRSMPQATYDSSSRMRRDRDPFVRAFAELQSWDAFRQTELDDLELWLTGTAHPLFFNSADASFLAGDPSASSRKQRSRTRTRSASNPNPSSQQIPRPGPFSTIPRAAPPATLLKPDEAKQLYQAYNGRWNALPPSNADIPYPARGLHVAALTNRDSIWAPEVTSPISAWSDDAVMQANIQAFFLGAVGLAPKYSEVQSTGKVEMGFDQIRATPAQIKELTEVLKKEKTRWHSDRLGRRNGSSGGTNEALQKDERARAVFHAVCELMEIVH